MIQAGGGASGSGSTVCCARKALDGVHHDRVRPLLLLIGKREEHAPGHEAGRVGRDTALPIDHVENDAMLAGRGERQPRPPRGGVGAPPRGVGNARNPILVGTRPVFYSPNSSRHALPGIAGAPPVRYPFGEEACNFGRTQSFGDGATILQAPERALAGVHHDVAAPE